jgi:hypothetical protein
MIGIFHDINFMEGLCDKKYNMQAGELIWRQIFIFIPIFLMDITT